MVRKNILTATIAVVTSITMMLAGCGSSSTSTSASGDSAAIQKGGDITIARSADVVSLLPTAVGDNPLHLDAGAHLRIPAQTQGGRVRRRTLVG